MESFKDKVILITGGSSGIGAATALRFARDGAQVVIGARRKEQSEAMVQQIESLGGQGLSIRTDVREGADIEALVAGTVTPRLRRQQRGHHRAGSHTDCGYRKGCLGRNVEREFDRGFSGNEIPDPRC